MNKSQMKSVFEAIEKKLKGQKHFTCMAHANKPAWEVLEELWQGGHKQFEFNGLRYNIEYTGSHITHGNRSTTPEYSVSRQTMKELYNADQVLAKTEIEVRHFHGGAVDMKKMGLQEEPYDFVTNGLLMEMINQIYENSDYNIMIQRHDTGDVTIWLDTKRFNQR